MDKVVFVGSKEQGFHVLKKMYFLAPERLTACITFDDREDTRSYYNSYTEFCEKNGIHLLVASKPSNIKPFICELKPDICFVVGWYFLIRQNIIDLVPRGFIGVHNSILPKYRGFAPLVWAIIRGEKKTGFSLFSFTEGMDEGKIWVQREIVLEENDYVEDALRKIMIELDRVFEEYYLDILDRKIEPKEQKDIEASYCAKRIPEDGKIDWRWSGEDVYNFIRAQSNPYTGAYTFLEENKIIIWKAKLIKQKYFGTPGQVAAITDTGVCIVCGDGSLLETASVEFNGVIGNGSEIIKSLNIRLH